MPFGLKLKKKREYSVASKSVLVVVIELLDGASVECTLGAHSSGRDCLHSACQRLLIARPELFGLRIARGAGRWRWADLDKPLRRQLNQAGAGAGAAPSPPGTPPLQLRLVHYLPACLAPPLLGDEMTRYHYFLQLKADVVEGRVGVEAGAAGAVAAYCRQAEYGNLDAERHTPEFVRRVVAFPAVLLAQGRPLSREPHDDRLLDSLTAAVITHHRTLRNLSQAQAEEGFIRACQQLSGYGQETFMARDQSRQFDVMIAISLTGIMVAVENSDSPKFYRWTDITNVINHKRTFTIECQNASDSASFVFETAQDGKYVWRMCVIQHTFYMKYQHIIHNEGEDSPSVNRQTQPKFQNDGISDSQDDLDYVPLNKLSSGSMPGLLETHDMKPLSHGGSQQGLQIENLMPLLNTQRALSTSCIDLTASNARLQTQNDMEKLRALLPSYRAAPDYDTAVQQKYHQVNDSPHFVNSIHTHSHPNVTKPFMFGSQPEIHRQVHYPDVTHHTAAINVPLRHHEDIPYASNIVRHEGYGGIPLESSPVRHPVHQQVQYLNVYKPPPPYPSNGLASNSTPDLAIASQSIIPVGYYRDYINSHVSGSSPDLVSSRTFLNRQYLNHLHAGNAHHVLGHPGFQNVVSAHGTYQNLAATIDTTKRHLMVESSHHINNQIQKIHDNRGNIVYCVPTTQSPYGNHVVLPQNTKFNNPTDSQEPIYENIPLPWQNDNSQIPRDKAHSISSDANRVIQRKVSQPISIMLNSEEKPLVSSQSNIATALTLPQSKYSKENAFVNTKVLNKSNNNVSVLSNDTKVVLNNNSLNNDITGISNSLIKVSISKESLSAGGEVGSNASLKGSIASLNTSNKTQVIQQSDSNNVTTITINSNDDIRPTILKSEFLTTDNVDSIQNNSHSSTLSSKYGLDITGPTSSFFDSTQQSSLYDFETSGASSSTTNSNKEKKKRRWGMFGGKNKTEVKSATLGRDKSKKSTNDQTEKYRRSAALPKLLPLPPSISKEKMCQLLENKMVDVKLSLDFERIPKGRDINTDITMALNPENSNLNNGNMDYLPYDDNRVRLTPSKFNKHGYINASHITATVGSNQRFYIACALGTQSIGSLAVSTALWQAVWEAGVRVIAFISTSITPPHLPESLPGRFKEFGQYQVLIESCQSTDYVITSRLRITNGKHGFSNNNTLGHTRTVWHLQYMEWPDNLVSPKSTDHFLGFLEELTAVRQHCSSEIGPLHNANPPVIVACSQGAGRSGVTITADLLLYRLEHNQELDIPRVVSLFNQQRTNLIQNVHQYRFIYALLVHYLKQTRLI